ncbi:MAG: Protein kinase, partial [Myxococcaceae bacterium]|nr:Protein kinase [Myxococcaceae bacterium]
LSMRNSSPVVLGEIIADKYQIEGVIGEGGMGIVVSAWHLGLRQRVAIKLLLSDGGMIEEAALERFQREARAAARIRSEHVCRVLDVGMLPAGTPYLVLEYLEGCDLSDELTRRGRLPADEAVGYVLEACEALAEAHLSGIIHRDLKPANLFLSRRSNGSRCLKLLDFGVSKSIAETSLAKFSLTKTSSIIGSPIYMSPEQLNSAKDVDERTDIWAMGALTYELLTGRPPFYGETIPQLVSQVLHTDPETFAALGVAAPFGLEDVLRKALSKKRDDRFATVGEFATAIGKFAPDSAMSVSRILQVRASSDVRDALPETLAEREVRRTPRSGLKPAQPVATPARAPTTLVLNERDGTAAAAPRSSWRWAWLALVLVALAGVAALLSRRSGAPAEAAADPTSLRALGGRDAGQAREVESARAAVVLPELPHGAVTPPAEPQVVLPVAPAVAPQSEPPKSLPVELPSGRSLPRGKARSDKPAGPSEHDNSNFGGRR